VYVRELSAQKRRLKVSSSAVPYGGFTREVANTGDNDENAQKAQSL